MYAYVLRAYCEAYSHVCIPLRHGCKVRPVVVGKTQAERVPQDVPSKYEVVKRFPIVENFITVRYWHAIRTCHSYTNIYGAPIDQYTRGRECILERRPCHGGRSFCEALMPGDGKNTDASTHVHTKARFARFQIPFSLPND
jgi:hypothetical protein